MTDSKNIESKDFAMAAAKVAVEFNSHDVTVVDLRGKSPATDFFVIATCTSGRQGRTVCDKIMELARENKLKRFGMAGYEQGKWILIDYVDVVVHVFDDEYRQYYELESLWGDAEIIEIAASARQEE